MFRFALHFSTENQKCFSRSHCSSSCIPAPVWLSLRWILQRGLLQVEWLAHSKWSWKSPYLQTAGHSKHALDWISPSPHILGSIGPPAPFLQKLSCLEKRRCLCGVCLQHKLKGTLFTPISICGSLVDSYRVSQVIVWIAIFFTS